MEFGNLRFDIWKLIFKSWDLSFENSDLVKYSKPDGSIGWKCAKTFADALAFHADPHAHCDDEHDDAPGEPELDVESANIAVEAEDDKE